jgi:hypothetical protein
MVHQLNSLGARTPVLRTLLFGLVETRVLPDAALVSLGLQALLGPGLTRFVQRWKRLAPA